MMKNLGRLIGGLFGMTDPAKRETRTKLIKRLRAKIESARELVGNQTRHGDLGPSQELFIDGGIAYVGPANLTGAIRCRAEDLHTHGSSDLIAMESSLDDIIREFTEVIPEELLDECNGYG